MSLTATAVKQAKSREKSYKLYDEKGMFLLVSPNGSRCWRFKYRYAGKEKTLALGVYPDLSLANARQKRDEARTELANGVDPAEAKKARRLASEQEAANSFRVIATEWFNTKMNNRSESHRQRTKRALEKDLYPQLGSQPVRHLSAQEILQALKKSRHAAQSKLPTGPNR